MILKNRRFYSPSRMNKIFIFPCFVGIIIISTYLIKSSNDNEFNELNIFHINNFSNDFFLIEPSILLQLDSETFENWFPSKVLSFNKESNVLTVGTFQQDFEFKTIEDFQSNEVIVGKSPFIPRELVLHNIVKTSHLTLHFVIFHKFKNFFWIGKIPNDFHEKLKEKYDISLTYFGKNEQIFDPFGITFNDSLKFQIPSEVGHFLGQISTSRYLHCTEDSKNWSKKYNSKFDPYKTKLAHQSLVSMKSFMKKLQFEFWIFCGSLLGWYRQCDAIPYTTDSDYATWATSLNGKDISEILRLEAPKHGLKLFYRFGEPTMTQEYSFKNFKRNFKSDLFFIYPNRTNFRIPLHVVKDKEWTYLYYPIFELCSAVLLSEKVLVPCKPEEVLKIEYGSTWMIPVKENKFDWIKSPSNVEPFRKFNFSIKQFTEYS